MTTLADLQAQRAGLLAARADPARSARFGSDEVSWRSDRELASAIAALDREIAGLEGRRVRTFLPSFSKGL